MIFPPIWKKILTKPLHIKEHLRQGQLIIIFWPLFDEHKFFFDPLYQILNHARRKDSSRFFKKL